MKCYFIIDLDLFFFLEGCGVSILKFGVKWFSDDKWNEYNFKNIIDSLLDFSIFLKILISFVRIVVLERGLMVLNI